MIRNVMRFLTMLIVLSGCDCGGPSRCGELVYDMSSDSCVCPEGTVPRPELGACRLPDGGEIPWDSGVDASFDGTDVSDAFDVGTDTFDVGTDTFDVGADTFDVGPDTPLDVPIDGPCFDDWAGILWGTFACENDDECPPPCDSEGGATVDCASGFCLYAQCDVTPVIAFNPPSCAGGIEGPCATDICGIGAASDFSYSSSESCPDTTNCVYRRD